ncbi:hypothetical protein ELQ90_04275 [Labedella phragmitis]|uniref:Uncharacterized protein n=1 Tax=Labedella phragmitis TaxID=2498849 RepID=A0A3S5CFK0_9MICO|nr:hypothetical protein [Labedella phragmitis]RWZ53145.1 hypothetical protein ELQ90_04275 [Labedella phragmitis]
MRRVLPPVTVAAVALVALSGCAGVPGVRDIGIASRSYSGLPDGMDPFTDVTVAPTMDPPLVSVEPTDLDPAPETVSPEDLDPTAIPDTDFSPRVAWLSDETLAIVTFGSSSCPAAPAALDLIGPDALDIALKRTGGDACTADLGPTTFEIDDPEGLDPSTTYTVTFDGRSASVLEPLS